VTAPLRVTVVAPYGVVGGAELWLLALLRATDRLTVDAVLLGDGPLRAELTGLGIPVRVLPTGRRPVDLGRSAARLAAALRRRDPVDLVLANGVKAALVAAPAARLAGLRCVWVKHDHSCDGIVTAALARLVDGLVASSPSLAAACGRADVTVVPPPRPDPPLTRERARTALAGHGLDTGDPRPVLAAVGRLVRYKGVEDAVRALARPGGEGWRLAVIGGPDPAEPAEPDRLRRLAEAEGVGDRVVFTGPVPGAAGLLSGVDAVAVLTKPTPDGPGREGFGATALEAMVAGVPVVAAAGGPVADRLAGVAGLAVPPGDPAAVAAALHQLADPGRRARLGAAGRVLTADHPTAADCADLLAGRLARVACRPGAGLAGGPALSVVVTVLDDAAATDRLLGQLAGQCADPADEVIVVDGGSRDGTAERVARWAAADPRIRLLVRPGAGISAGRNAGIEAARNRVVACTDAGCDPVPGWWAALRAAAAEQPDGLLTGVYRPAVQGPLQVALAAVGYPDPAELRHPGPLARCYGRVFGRFFDATMPTGRSVAFPVAAWRAAGGFPEHLQTGEDVLFGRSVVAAGAPALLVADAEVVWAQRPSLPATARMYFRYGEGSGQSRDRRLLGRDLARLAAYGLAPALLARGGRRGRLWLAAGGAGYLSLPVARVLRGSRPGAPAGTDRRRDRWSETAPALALLPVAAAVRDLSKIAGALRGLRRAGHR
jgi:glycosyltransferase involved in cell wall biosynthesis/GT2 family glycosyltransferase